MISTEDDLRSLLAHVAAATPVGPPPTGPAVLPRRRARRTRAVVLSTWAAAILIPVAGLGAASAAGLIPVGALSAFPDNANNANARMDLTTAKLVVSIPGPPGQRFDVWVAHGAHGYQCVSFLFKPTAAAVGAPSGRDFLMGVCDQPPRHGDVFNSTGGGSGGGGSDTLPAVYALSAGAAVRADVRLPDGGVLAANTANGWIAGWIPAGVNTAGAILTGYAADGSIVGHADVGAPPIPTG